MFVRYVGLGIGAGLVSALLFGAVATASPPGILLVYIAPLPIMIVALGWHHLLGLLAAATGAFAISVALRSNAGLAYAVAAGLPAWWLSVLALRAGRPDAPGKAGPERLGRLLLGLALTAAAIALVAAVGLGRGDYAAYSDGLTRVTETLLRAQFGIPRDGPLPQVSGVSGAAFARFLVEIAPAVGAGVFTLVLALNLWAAAKVVGLSGRLPGPWRPLPMTRMPLAALVALAASVFLSFMPAYAGLAGRALSGAMSIAFTLQGLAFIHDATRGRGGRGVLLALVYGCALFLGGAILPLVSVLGVVDVAMPLRARLAQRRNPPPPPSR